jgi:hypothetical protein
VNGIQVPSQQDSAGAVRTRDASYEILSPADGGAAFSSSTPCFRVAFFPCVTYRKTWPQRTTFAS